jgi:hypothetical protein
MPGSTYSRMNKPDHVDRDDLKLVFKTVIDKQITYDHPGIEDRYFDRLVQRHNEILIGLHAFEGTRTALKWVHPHARWIELSSGLEDAIAFAGDCHVIVAGEQILSNRQPDAARSAINERQGSLSHHDASPLSTGRFTQSAKQSFQAGCDQDSAGRL